VATAVGEAGGQEHMGCLGSFFEVSEIDEVDGIKIEKGDEDVLGSLVHLSSGLGTREEVDDLDKVSW